MRSLYQNTHPTARIRCSEGGNVGVEENTETVENRHQCDHRHLSSIEINLEEVKGKGGNEEHLKAQVQGAYIGEERRGKGDIEKNHILWNRTRCRIDHRQRRQRRYKSGSTATDEGVEWNSGSTYSFLNAEVLPRKTHRTRGGKEDRTTEESGKSGSKHSIEDSIGVHSKEAEDSKQ